MRPFWLVLITLSGVPVPAQGTNAAAPEAPAVIARDATGAVTVRAVRLVEPIVVDGELSDPVYFRILPVTGFLQQEPREGSPASEATEAWVLFDDDHLYIAARLHDSAPEKMVANEMRRDHFNISRGESFTVVLDTFHDRRNGFYFETNPLGALRDGLITDESDLNTDWNTVWSTKATRGSEGWAVEMAIPFRSLRYRGGEAPIWGLQLKRQIQWKNEDTFLTPVPASWQWRGIRKLSSAATLVGLELPRGGRNVEVKPFATSGLTTDRSSDPVVENDLMADAGVDVKLGVTKGLTADFTVNTDFAQVEADEQQLNLTRFSLFFPEKRDFFLEGQGIFAFGGEAGSGFQFGPPSYTPILFFSRQIGISGSESTPIRAGGRLTGRAGAFTLGLLNVQTGEDLSRGALATNFSVMRLRRDLFRRSSIGAIFTNRSVATSGEGTNRVYGIDGNFAFFQNLLINTYYARSDTEALTGDDRSYMAKLENNGDRYGVELQHLMVGGDFNPEVGFVRRSAFRRNRGQFRFSPRPGSIEAVRKFSFRAEADFFHNLEGALETRELTGEAGAELENGDEWSLSAISSLEVLAEPFEIAPSIVIPSGSYDFNRVEASYRLGTQRRISGRLSASAGGFFSGKRTEAAYSGRVEVSSRLSLEPSLSINWVDLAEGSFTAELLRARVTYALSPRMFVSGLVQFNSTASALSTNVRFRWEYEPGSDLFVVYSDGRNTTGLGFPAIESRGVVVKLTKLVRF